MGTVYRAHDQTLRREVAIKLLSNTRLGTEGRARLLREAQIVAGLDHPNIVTVFDVGEYQGDPFIVMQLLEGGTLHDHRPGSLEETVEITKQICAALDYAHQQGIIHRDLKPENVALSADGTARLMDFGLARSVATRMTVEGAIMGTVNYMAPEQALGKELDQRADLYAFGVLMYELTTGQLPFEADNPVAVITQHLHAPVVPPRAKNPDIPDAIDKLIVQLMAKEPDDRPASARQILKELQAPDVLTPGASPEEQLSTLDRIVRGRMVGREAEFNRAQELWYEAEKGKSQVLLVSGEPGVGKTRLLQEIITQAEVMGAEVVGSASYAEGGPPYSPFKKMLRDIVPKASRTLSDLPATVIADLLALAPELKAHYPDVPTKPKDDPQTELHRLYESFFIFIATLSQKVPLLIYLDDAHWADSGSLGIFRHLARQIGSQPIMLLATYREVELDEDRPLNEVLLDLSRERHTSRIKLNRLTVEQAEQLLAYFFQEEITPDFLEGIYRETEGNPFFMEEVCKALVQSGQLFFQDGRWVRPDMNELGIPQNVKVAIQSRLGKLSSDTQEILSQAAVLGREFDFDSLLMAAKVEEDAVIVALEEAERAQLIEEKSENGRLSFAFSHALIGAVLVEGMRILQRRRLHRHAVEALEKFDPENYSAISKHLLEAGQIAKGVKYLLLAGDRARTLYAHNEAIHSYQQVLDFAKDNQDHALAARTLMKIGITYHNAFQFERSRLAYEKGFAYWQRTSTGQSLRKVPDAPHALRLAAISPPTIDPGLADDTNSSFFINQLFCGLIEMAPDMSVVPNIARSWDVHDEGRRYIFHLRDDVLWSDGQPVTAGDFEFAWKRVLDPALGSSASKYLLDIRGASDFNQHGGPADGVGVRADGDYTLLVELETPASYFLQLLQVSATFPVPRHVVQMYGENWIELDKIVTNGPFKIKSWAENNVQLERNQKYHGQFLGNIDELAVRILSSEDNLNDLYLEDKLDVLHFWNLLPKEHDRVRQSHAGEYITCPILSVINIGFDTSRPPFDDIRVRRAFALAIDREALAEVELRGVVTPATGGMVPLGMPGHHPNIALQYDPKAARKLFSEAGYADPKHFPNIECLVPEFPIISQPKRFITSQLQHNLGITLSWKSKEWGDVINHLNEELPHLWLGGWIADYPDPDSFLRIAIERYLTGRVWKNSEYTALVERARQTQDQSVRLKLYEQAQGILATEVPLIPLFYDNGHLLLKPWISDFPLSPIRWDYLKDVVIQPHN